MNALPEGSSLFVTGNERSGFSGIATARSVIQQEMEGLRQLLGALDDSFEEAVRILIATRGRVIVSGMGKSGHIARKVAATLSATGTPSFFVHPAEASHGDLGMLKASDTLLVFSNSGKTRELTPIFAHAAALSIPIITIASRGDTPLTRGSTINLLLPPVAEACLVKIAPTTSTTMMLALGDALAVAAMELRGVSRTDVMQWHPGGDIGWRMLPVDHLLRAEIPLPLVREDTRMRDVVLEMTSAGKGVAGVVDDAGHLIGIITDGDVRRSFDHVMIATAREVMNREPITIPSGTSIEDAHGLLGAAKITVMFVMDAADPRKPIGLVHIHDLAAGG